MGVGFQGVVWDSGFGVEGLGFEVWALVWGLRVWGFRFGFRVLGFGFRVSGSGLLFFFGIGMLASGFGFLVFGFWFWVHASAAPCGRQNPNPKPQAPNPNAGGIHEATVQHAVLTDHWTEIPSQPAVRELQKASRLFLASARAGIARITGG